MRESLEFVKSLDSETRAIVKDSYEDAIHVTLSFSVLMAACGLASSFFIKEKALPARK